MFSFGRFYYWLTRGPSDSNGLISCAAEIAVANATAKTARYQTNLVLLQSHNSRDCPQDTERQRAGREMVGGCGDAERTQNAGCRTQTKGKCDNGNCTISTRKQLWDERDKKRSPGQRSWGEIIMSTQRKCNWELFNLQTTMPRAILRAALRITHSLPTSNGIPPRPNPSPTPRSFIVLWHCLRRTPFLSVPIWCTSDCHCLCYIIVMITASLYGCIWGVT